MVWIVGGDLLTLFTPRRFCSLPFGQNIRILEFFGSDLHLDFCTSGCPTPWQPLRATNQISLPLTGFLSLFQVTLQAIAIVNATRQWCLSHLLHSCNVLKQHLLAVFFFLYKYEEKKEETGVILWAWFCMLCKEQHVETVWFSSSAPHPGWNTMDCEAGLWLLTHSADSALYAASQANLQPRKVPWCVGQSSFESYHKAIRSLVLAHLCSFAEAQGNCVSAMQCGKRQINFSHESQLQK